MQSFRPIVRLIRLAFIATLMTPAAAEPASAQVVRGVVRSGTSLLPIDLATVTATDSLGTVFGSAITSSLGEFQMDLRQADVRFELHVRRLGFAETTASVQPLARTDTVDFELLMNEVAALSDAVVVSAEPSLNERRLNEANRRGWTVYEPELVARHRDRASDFFQLLRSLGTPSLILPRRLNDCIRATRNNRCLTIVIDNQVMGPSATILPSDIYFLAVLGASEARIQFGDRAPYGAIAIYTRSQLDRLRRPRNSP